MICASAVVRRAKVWAQNIEKERELMLVTTDPHGPNEFRVNGALTRAVCA